MKSALPIFIICMLLGCVGQAPRYVCSNGRIVDDQNLCLEQAPKSEQTAENVHVLNISASPREEEVPVLSTEYLLGLLKIPGFRYEKFRCEHETLSGKQNCHALKEGNPITEFEIGDKLFLKRDLILNLTYMPRYAKPIYLQAYTNAESGDTLSSHSNPLKLSAGENILYIRDEVRDLDELPNVTFCFSYINFTLYESTRSPYSSAREPVLLLGAEKFTTFLSILSNQALTNVSASDYMNYMKGAEQAKLSDMDYICITTRVSSQEYMGMLPVNVTRLPNFALFDVGEFNGSFLSLRVINKRGPQPQGFLDVKLKDTKAPPDADWSYCEIINAIRRENYTEVICKTKTPLTPMNSYFVMLTNAADVIVTSSLVMVPTKKALGQPANPACAEAGKRNPLIITMLSTHGVGVRNLGCDAEVISSFVYRDLSAGETVLRVADALDNLVINASTIVYKTVPFCVQGNLYYIEIRTRDGLVSTNTARCGESREVVDAAVVHAPSFSSSTDLQITDIVYYNSTTLGVSVSNGGANTATISQINVQDISVSSTHWYGCLLSDTDIAPKSTRVVRCSYFGIFAPGDSVYIELRTTDGVTLSELSR